MGVFDVVAVVYAAASIVALLVFFGAIVRVRDLPYMAARGSRFIAAMCLAGVVHIAVSVVSHQHIGALVALERLSCVTWGYWLPYTAVGAWFTCQYLQILTYTSILSHRMTEDSTRRLLRVRPVIAVATMAPPMAIALLVSVSPTAVRVDPRTATCTSEIWAKMSITTWVLLCIVALSASLIWLKHSLSRDAVSELPRQSVVLVVSVLAAAAQVYVIAIASRGLDDEVNRVLATITIATMYTVSASVLALRPLWKIVVRGSTEYDRVETQKLITLQQPVHSVITLLERSSAAPNRELRKLVADFIVYCANPLMPRMDRGSVCQPTHPMGITALYVSADAWTRNALGDSYDYVATPYGARKSGGFPPLFSDDIKRTANNICDTFFEFPHGHHAGERSDTGPLGVPEHIVQDIVGRDVHDGTLFRELLWWCLGVLDEYYGDEYLTAMIMRRPVYIENHGVRIALVDVLTHESQLRLHHGGVHFPAARAGVMGAFSSDDDADAPADAGVSASDIVELSAPPQVELSSSSSSLSSDSAV